MRTKFQRYEAVVKLSNEKVVQYHNINTGLFKFHKFIIDKFTSNDKWLFYTVRRIENKEIIDTFVNATPDRVVKGTRIYTPSEPNTLHTGYIFSLPFIRENTDYIVNRNVFVSNTQVLERNSHFITINDRIYHKMIEEAKMGLYEYYIGKQHQVVPEDFSLALEEIEIEKTQQVIPGKRGTEPKVDYP